MDTNNKCLSCGKEETEVPLVSVRYSGTDTWICSQCLPTLIHKQENLQVKLDDLTSGKL